MSVLVHDPLMLEAKKCPDVVASEERMSTCDNATHSENEAVDATAGSFLLLATGEYRGKRCPGTSHMPSLHSST